MRTKRIPSFLIIILTCNPVFTQVDLNKLNGHWLVEKIILLENGTITRGKYAETNAYVQFNFDRLNRLIVTTSPFDMGKEQSYTLKGNEIHMLIPDVALQNYSEKKYTIKELTKSTLILQTKNADSKDIEYAMLRLEVNEEKAKSIEYEPIIIKQTGLASKTKRYDYQYNFKTKTHQFLQPMYQSDYTFGSDLCNAVKYPANFEQEKQSEELVLKITINSSGKVKKAEKLQAFNPTIDKHVTKFMKKTRWIPLSVNNQTIESELIFHFIFLLNSENELEKKE